MIVHRLSGILASFVCSAMCLAIGNAAYAQEDTVLNYDPSKIIEDEAANCAQCHEKTVAAWMESTHKKTYDELHLRDEAQAILDRIGDRGSIRRNDECVQCHYTQHARDAGGRARTIMGVSCQRCHGAAKDWLEIHQDTEKYPDRTERLKLAEEKGMRPTYNIYKLASNCFQCHTVPREHLVNAGEHPAGSDFDLVAWSQGEVRHNFLPLPDEAENKEAPIETKRVLFVMGKLLDLEHGLRGLAKATEEGAYLTAMSERVQAAYDAVEGFSSVAPQIQEILDAVPKDGGSLKFAAGNEDEYMAAVEKISELAQAVEANADQSKLAAVDSNIPAEYKGTPYE